MAKKKPKYWQDGRIPAELFFEILSERDYQLLMIKGRISPKKLEKAWDDIFDEFFLLRDDPKLRIMMRLQESIRKIKHKIEVVNNVLKVLMILDLPKEMLIQVCDSLKKIRIVIDPETSIPKQIKNIQEFRLAHLETELKIEKDKLKGMSKDQKTTYEEGLVSIENVLGRPTGENLTLRKYCALEKSSKAKSKQLDKLNKKKK